MSKIEAPESEIVRVGSTPEQKTLAETGDVFPLVLEAGREAKGTGEGEASAEAKGAAETQWREWIGKHKGWVEEQLHVYGAIVFRGLWMRTAADFDVFVDGFNFEHLPYVGGAAPRTNVVGRVFTTNESPPDVPIPFHHEMAQVPNYPQRVLFFCQTPPAAGGETPLCPSTVVYNRMRAAHPEFVDKLARLGVRYVRVLPDGDDRESPIGRGWQSTFNVSTPADAEVKCASLGSEFEWLPDGSMKTITKVLPALKQHPVTGKWAWFNSIIAAYTGWVDKRNVPEKAVIFGDNSPMDQQPVLDCLAIMNELAVDIKWQTGDVFLVDNHQVLHARRNFVPPRSIYAALIKS
eukprot:TRINITY_DN15763_c0_g1_i1.p1 TRINITY_DN15763_c0_g1~~TRINITY_DN15763_c0_g1_i1.p1  ORF type:complete len:349 (-),score=69.97 TRINITY_DN15763_c0_g1_i1:59-1105(-)